MTVAHEETPTRQINIPGMKHVLIVCQYLAAAFSRCKLTRGVCMHFFAAHSNWHLQKAQCTEGQLRPPPLCGSRKFA